MLLRSIPGDADRPALIFPTGEVLSAGRLRAWGESVELALWRDRVRGASVAVYCRDNARLAMTLLALDGVAGRITLVPPGLSAEESVALCAKAGVTRLLAPGERFELPGGDESAPPPMPQATLTPGGESPPPLVTEWVIPTSGTTRTPKLVVHTLASLSRSVKRDASVGSELRWGLLYDLNRFAGLQVFFQAVFGGSTLVIPPRGENLEVTVARFVKAGCNALSATPTLWRKLLMTPGTDGLPLRRITLGGEIADRFVLGALHARFPEAKISHIYASTEAGVGFSVNDGAEGFPLSYLSGGVAGVDMRVNDEGVLELRPPCAPGRYPGESTAISDADGFVNTGDRVKIEGDRVYFLGRDSGAINVGGNKVHPEEVERALLAHPAVALVAVSAKRSGITGALVEARVVVREPGVTVSELREWCSARLERHKVPALIRIVEDLDTGASGKILRQ